MRKWKEDPANYLIFYVKLEGNGTVGFEGPYEDRREADSVAERFAPRHKIPPTVKGYKLVPEEG